MKIARLLKSILLLMCLSILSVQAQQLKFGEDKKFKIVQFTDVHWVADSLASEEAGERMNEVLDAEKPDLVVYTGDVIFGRPADKGMQRALE
ncbi:MAG: metallophosphoesterase, partial [Bacteroides sp.]|nr:metallophosphoesterase [Bacteroides sp.]